MSIHTVLLTRFNMVLPEFHRAGHRIADAAMRQWLDNRIAIFEHVCVPSVTAQTRLPDVWMIGLDALHRDAVVRLLDAVRPYPWIMPVWQEFENRQHNDAYWTLKQAIGKTFPPHGTHLLTTRLDNDDALNVSYCDAAHAQAVSAIQSAPGRKDFWISFPSGLQLSGDVCRSMQQENNAFLTRCIAIESGATEWQTALDGNHRDVFHRGEVILSSIHAPMWLQYVHGTNLLNTERQNLHRIEDTRAELAQFGLCADLLDFKPPHVDRASLFESGSAPQPKTTPAAHSIARRVKTLFRKTFGPRA